jgi:hypothetical protein
LTTLERAEIGLFRELLSKILAFSGAEILMELRTENPTFPTQVTVRKQSENSQKTVRKQSENSQKTVRKQSEKL